LRIERGAFFGQAEAMNDLRFFALALAVAACGGCSGGNPPAVPTAAGGNAIPGLPTQAQPRLRTVKLWLGPEEMVTELAATEVQVQTGMMFRTNMAENESMLFDLGFPHRVSFWMPNCPLPLSVAYINSDGVIDEIHDLKPYDTNLVYSVSERIQFALETRQGWFERHGIKAGMALRTERGSLRQTFSGTR
jgi:uncharacterized protein